MEEQKPGADLEKNEGLTMEKPEDSFECDAKARLEWWEVAERRAEEAESQATEAIAVVREAEKTGDNDRAMIEEHLAIEALIAKKPEEDRSRAFGDAEALGFSEETDCTSDSDDEW